MKKYLIRIVDGIDQNGEYYLSMDGGNDGMMITQYQRISKIMEVIRPWTKRADTHFVVMVTDFPQKVCEMDMKDRLHWLGRNGIVLYTRGEKL